MSSVCSRYVPYKDSFTSKSPKTSFNLEEHYRDRKYGKGCFDVQPSKLKPLYDYDGNIIFTNESSKISFS